MSDGQATVFIIDNDNSLRESLQWLLETAGIVSADFPTGEAFLAAVDGTRAGCVLLDVRLSGMSGVVLQAAMQRADLRLPVIVMTGFADVDTAVRMFKAGAFDFFEKPFADLLLLERIEQAIVVDATRRAARARGDALASRLGRLTARERAVFEQVVHGKPNKVVAGEFGISEKTVEVHRARVMHKLGATSLAELVRMDLLVHHAGDSLRLSPA
jgi:FixJ family two-component response regulator